MSAHKGPVWDHWSCGCRDLIRSVQGEDEDAPLSSARQWINRRSHQRKADYRWYEATSSMDVPPLPGVYALFYEGDEGQRELEYIGSSTNISNRLRNYGQFRSGKYGGRKDWIQSARDIGYVVKYRISSYAGEWAMREIRLIERLAPPGNTKHNPNKRKAA